MQARSKKSEAITRHPVIAEYLRVHGRTCGLTTTRWLQANKHDVRKVPGREGQGAFVTSAPAEHGGTGRSKAEVRQGKSRRTGATPLGRRAEPAPPDIATARDVLLRPACLSLPENRIDRERRPAYTKPRTCPGGGIGRRARFRSVCRKAWRFESSPGHHS